VNTTYILVTIVVHHFLASLHSKSCLRPLTLILCSMFIQEKVLIWFLLLLLHLAWMNPITVRGVDLCASCCGSYEQARFHWWFFANSWFSRSQPFNLGTVKSFHTFMDHQLCYRANCSNFGVSWKLHALMLGKIFKNVRFSKVDRIRIANLRPSIKNLKQGSKFVLDYFTEMEMLWEELNSLYVCF
jgi:hypothetical protein